MNRELSFCNPISTLHETAIIIITNKPPARCKHKKISIKNFLPTDAWYIYTESRSFISAQELAEEIGIKGDVTNSVAQAISLYIKKSKSNDLVYIGGSIHVVAEALEILDKSHTLI